MCTLMTIERSFVNLLSGLVLNCVAINSPARSIAKGMIGMRKRSSLCGINEKTSIVAII